MKYPKGLPPHDFALRWLPRLVAGAALLSASGFRASGLGFRAYRV